MTKDRGAHEKSKPPLRRMFDVLNACPWHTQELRTDYLIETLIARGMSRADATATAADAYKKWDAATRIMHHD